MGSGRIVTGWIECPVIDPTVVRTLRDQLYGWLGAPDPYRRESDPHVSVFGVRLPLEKRDAFETAFESFADSIGPRCESVDGYHLYPSVRNPMVVSLDVSFDLDAVASPIADLLAGHGGRIGRGPTPPHVTLFKGGVRGEELQWAQLDESVRTRLRSVRTDGDTPLDPPSAVVCPTFEITLGRPRLTWN